jgi:RNA polymerase sigma-70 factor (ECF subfamily)
VAGDERRSAISGELARAYTERGARLRAIASRAGPEEAADLVQEAFLKTVEAGGKAEVEKPVNLLFRIARNAVIDRLRSKGRAAALFRNEEADAADSSASPERILIASERLKRAMACIEHMPPKRREVFLLHRLEGLSYAEIARQAGISIKTVEKHMACAMAQLSREVDDD